MVRAVRINNLEKHPNADRLEIATVYCGYKVIVGKSEFSVGDIAIFLTVDTLAPISRPEFKFLDTGHGRTHERIKAKKLRGVFSFGLLVPNLIGAVEGEDVAEKLGCLKYLPPAERERSSPINTMRKARISETAVFDRKVLISASFLSILTVCFLHGWPALLGLLPLLAGSQLVRYNRWKCKRPNYPYYDVTSYRAYKHLVADGEDVAVTEKLHGSQASFCHTGRKFHVKSRTVFRDPVLNNDKTQPWGFNFTETWWGIAKKYELEKKLATHPNLVLFGEIVGPDIQKGFSYGCRPGEHAFYAFDAMDLSTRKFLDHHAFVSFCELIQVPTVPVLYVGSWSEELTKMAEGKSTLADHIKEGIVFRPTVERYDNHSGRVQLKFVQEGFLLRKSAEDDET